MSDIVIRNMKMPKSCQNCPLCIVESTGLNFFCARQIGKRFSIELLDQRQEGCPLVELPPHGDLGDISDLYANLMADIQTSKIQTLQDVLKILKIHFDNAPVILEANYKEDYERRK